jgi:hypothetical protein
MPSEQEILLNFVGSNYGIMKKLDDQIIGSSSTLGRRSDELKKVLNDVATQTQPQPQHVPQIHVIPTPQHNQPTITQQIEPRPTPQSDGQLWLDFKERDKVYDLLDTIIEKQNLILKRLEKLENNYTITRKRGL